MMKDIENVYCKIVDLENVIKFQDSIFHVEVNKIHKQTIENLKEELKKLIDENYDEVLGVLENLDDHIKNSVSEGLKKFRATSYGLQGIYEDHPEETEAFYKELSNYYKTRSNYYHSLGINTLKHIEFLLNLEKIVKGIL